MEFFVDGLNLRLVYVGVNLGCGKGFVAEELLHDS